MFLVPMFVFMVRRYLRDRVNKKMGTESIELGKRTGYPTSRMDVRHSVEMPSQRGGQGALQGPNDPVEVSIV